MERRVSSILSSSVFWANQAALKKESKKTVKSDRNFMVRI